MKSLLIVIIFSTSLLAGEPQARYKISKETTYVLGPLDEDGYIDYAEALHKKLSQGVTTKNNANVLVWKVLGPRPEGGKMPQQFFQWMGIKEPPVQGDYFKSFYTYLKKRNLIGPGGMQKFWKQLDQASKRPWTGAKFPELAGWIQDNQKPLDLLRKMNERPRYYSPVTPVAFRKPRAGLISALLPAVQKCRALARALELRAMFYLGAGKPEEAWKDLLTCHRLGRLMTQGATLIEALVGYALSTIAVEGEMKLIQYGKLSSKQAMKHLDDLRKLPPIKPMEAIVEVGERFMFLDTVRLIDQGGISAVTALILPRRAEKIDPRIKPLMSRINWSSALKNANQWYDRLVVTLRGDPSKGRAYREKQLDKLEARMKKLRKSLNDDKVVRSILAGQKKPEIALGEIIGDILLAELLPALRKVQNATDRTRQFDKVAQIAFALEAYRQDQKRYPEKLAKLTPKYLKKIPKDIFSEKELIYRAKKTSYLLYSVGVNGLDDKGRWWNDKPLGDDIRARRD